jgi:hypothetical protein
MKKAAKQKKGRNKQSGLNVRQELFCMYYVMNDELRGNATLSYAEAYGYDLDDREKYPRDDAIYDDEDENEEGDVEDLVDIDPTRARKRRLRRRYGRYVIKASSFDRATSVCAVEGSKALRKPKIQAKIQDLRLKLLDEKSVDSMLAFWIQQKKEPSVSLGAIREYNKLNNRIKDIIELTGPGGGPLDLKEKRRAELDAILANNVPQPASH